MARISGPRTLCGWGRISELGRRRLGGRRGIVRGQVFPERIRSHNGLLITVADNIAVRAVNRDESASIRRFCWMRRFFRMDVAGSAAISPRNFLSRLNRLAEPL